VDELTPPPGKTLISLRLANFSMGATGTIRSPGYDDRDVVMVFKLHDGHLDTMVADAATGQDVEGVEGISGLIQRWVADFVGELVDVTTEPTYHLHFLSSTDSGTVMQDITPFSQPPKAVH
jgi:hypothetical protein